MFDRLGIDESGKVRGIFRATGIRPKFAERLATAGCRLRSRFVRIAWRSERVSNTMRSTDRRPRLRCSDAAVRSSSFLCWTSVSRRPACCRDRLASTSETASKPSRSKTSPYCATRCSVRSRRSTHLLRRSDRVSALQKMLSQADIKTACRKFHSPLRRLAASWLGLHRSTLPPTRFRSFAWIGFLLGFFLPYAYAIITSAPSASASLKNCFPRRSTRWLRAVRAGHAFTTALEMISRRSLRAGGQRISGNSYEEQKFGLPVREALSNLVGPRTARRS